MKSKSRAGPSASGRARKMCSRRPASPPLGSPCRSARRIGMSGLPGCMCATCGATVRGTYGTPPGTRMAYVQYVEPWCKLPCASGTYSNAGGWHPFPIRTARKNRDVGVSSVRHAVLPEGFAVAQLRPCRIGVVHAARPAAATTLYDRACAQLQPMRLTLDRGLRPCRSGAVDTSPWGQGALCRRRGSTV